MHKGPANSTAPMLNELMGSRPAIRNHGNGTNAKVGMSAACETAKRTGKRKHHSNCWKTNCTCECHEGGIAGEQTRT